MNERADQRIDAAIGVVVRFGGTVQPCLSRTVSRHGLSVTTPHVWPIDTVVEVELVQGGVRVRARARVVSHQPGGLGLEFVDTDAGFEQAMGGLLANLVGGANPSRVEPPDELREVGWSLTEAGGGIGGYIRGRQHKARLMDVSVDGAAIAGKNPPELGTEIAVYLPNYVEGKGSDQVNCLARVVRHTEHGFAVQFVSPSAVFRRVVSQIRKAARR